MKYSSFAESSIADAKCRVVKCLSNANQFKDSDNFYNKRTLKNKNNIISHKNCYIKLISKFMKSIDLNSLCQHTYYSYTPNIYQKTFYGHWANKINRDLFDAMIVCGIRLPKKNISKDIRVIQWYSILTILKRFIRKREKKFKDRLFKKIHVLNTQITHFPNIGNNKLYSNLGIEFKKNLFNFNPNIVPPQHITPCDLLNLNNSNVIISEKADGITVNDYDFKDVSPRFPKEMQDFHVQCEYLEKLNIYIVFDIHNHREYISDMVINQLRYDHPFVNNSTDLISNFIGKDIYYRYVEEEKRCLEKYLIYLKETGSVGWWPKKIWHVEQNNLITILNLLNVEKMDSVYPCDGLIIKDINTLNSYKLKPYKHLTLDLKYTTNGWITSDNKIISYVKNKNIDSNIPINTIFRCYWENDNWIPKEIRNDKKNPNNNLIEQLLHNQHINKWYPYNIQKLLKTTNPYYHMELKDKFRYSNSIEKHVNTDSSILDIGCGNINLRYKKYIGLDINLNLINKKDSDRFILLNFAKPWNIESQQDFFGSNIWNYMNVNLECLNKKFDNILVINSIQYSANTKKEWNNFVNEITFRAKKDTKLIIRYLCEHKLKKLFDNIKGDVINKYPSFVRKIDPPKGAICEFWIKIYYDWCHISPIEEPVLSEKNLHDLTQQGWKKQLIIEMNDKGTDGWDDYMNCFETCIYKYDPE